MFAEFLPTLGPLDAEAAECIWVSHYNIDHNLASISLGNFVKVKMFQDRDLGSTYV